MPTTVETLTLIWRRVLQRSPISPEDSFFDIGGTDALADLLCSEIGQVYGRPLPSATLRQAPTIAALADILEKPTPRRPSPFVHLKAGSKKPPIFMAYSQRLRLFATRLRGHVNQMRQLPLPSAFSYFVCGVKRRLRISRALGESQGPSEMLGLPFGEAALRRVKQKAYLAYANYQPRFYRGKIHFVTAEIKSFFPGDPATIWADLAAELEIEIIPGNHLNIVTTQFEPLALVLTRYIQHATCRIR